MLSAEEIVNRALRVLGMEVSTTGPGISVAYGVRPDNPPCITLDEYSERILRPAAEAVAQRLAAERLGTSQIETYDDGLCLRWIGIYEVATDQMRVCVDAKVGGLPVANNAHPVSARWREYINQNYTYQIAMLKEQARATPGDRFSFTVNMPALEDDIRLGTQLRIRLPDDHIDRDHDRRQQQSHRDAQAAATRSLELLKDWLTPIQRADFERYGCFDVRGSDGGSYRLSKASNFNIASPDGKKFCAIPKQDGAPIGDQLLAQKIALETDEPSVLKVANKA